MLLPSGLHGFRWEIHFTQIVFSLQLIYYFSLIAFKIFLSLAFRSLSFLWIYPIWVPLRRKNFEYFQYFFSPPSLFLFFSWTSMIKMLDLKVIASHVLEALWFDFQSVFSMLFKFLNFCGLIFNFILSFAIITLMLTSSILSFL